MKRDKRQTLSDVYSDEDLNASCMIVVEWLVWKYTKPKQICYFDSLLVKKPYQFSWRQLVDVKVVGGVSVRAYVTTSWWSVAKQAGTETATPVHT